MDDKRNAMMFQPLQEDCSWKIEGTDRGVDRCWVTDKPCQLKNCEPFRFALFFNRPEVKNG